MEDEFFLVKREKKTDKRGEVKNLPLTGFLVPISFNE